MLASFAFDDGSDFSRVGLPLLPPPPLKADTPDDPPPAACCPGNRDLDTKLSALELDSLSLPAAEGSGASLVLLRALVTEVAERMLPSLPAAPPAAREVAGIDRGVGEPRGCKGGLPGALAGAGGMSGAGAAVWTLHSDEESGERDG